MEPESPTDDCMRNVDLCIVGVRHDALEAWLGQAMQRESLEGEVVFWESVPVEYSDRLPPQHWGLETGIMHAFQLLFSAFSVAYIDPHVSASGLGHGDDPWRHYERLAAFRPDSLYWTMSEQNRALFHLVSTTFSIISSYLARASTEQMIDTLSSICFGGNKSFASQFTTLLEDGMTSMPLEDGRIVLTKELESLLSRFMYRIHRAISGCAGGKCGTRMQSIAILLLEKERGVSVGRFKDYVYELGKAVVLMRDEASWEAVIRIVCATPGVRRVIIVAGAAHIDGLYSQAINKVLSIKRIQTEPIPKATPEWTVMDMRDEFMAVAIDPWRQSKGWSPPVEEPEEVVLSSDDESESGTPHYYSGGGSPQYHPRY